MDRLQRPVDPKRKLVRLVLVCPFTDVREETHSLVGRRVRSHRKLQPDLDRVATGQASDIDRRSGQVYERIRFGPHKPHTELTGIGQVID